ncbi:MAG: type II toxin-antitoxin system RelE/ParE family toxin [Alphaproteobacteria bacterium]|nr:type II toxin-antitoxin system RelE/ParE family toxin [Alphaproteobacteria bacterium]
MAEIASYLISEASEEIAHRIVSGILARLNELRDFPETGARRDHIAPGLRIVIRQNYVAYYKATETEIVAVRVLHGSRDVGAIAGRGGFGPDPRA